jgi:flagellar biosynthetic protein FliR
MQNGFPEVAGILSQIFALAISVAAPFIAVDFIITLGFGVLGKVAPRINVMLISFSFRIVGGMLIFATTANLIFNFLLHYAQEIPMGMLQHLTH